MFHIEYGYKGIVGVTLAQTQADAEQAVNDLAANKDVSDVLVKNLETGRVEFFENIVAIKKLIVGRKYNEHRI